jgi:hypothetical protein
MSNWEKLCDQVNPLIKKDVDEDLFHSLFESYLKAIFNWDETSIIHKPPVQMGREKKEADIVLRGNDFGIVIEMKRPNITLGFEEIDQLTSYMRFLKYRYGLLIGKMIKVFYDDDTVGGQLLEVASFDFDVKNYDGIALSDILDKSICSNKKLKEYVDIRIKQQKDKEREEKLKKELLADNCTKIKEILKNKLISDGHDEEIICNILNDIVIKLKNETGKNEPNGTGKGKTPIPPPDNFLNEVMNYYNSICDQNFEFDGTQKKYRIRAIIENEKQLHYEFLDRKSYMGIEIHIENERFNKLNDIISSFTGKNIRGYTIETMSRGVKISVPNSAGKEECSLVMKELINLTYEKIRDEYKKLKL